MTQDSFRGRLILVVDDEVRMVRFIRLNLEHDGFQVISAYNGREALEQVRSQLPNLILLDVMMPDLDGFEVLAEIKGDPELRRIPVVVLTTSQQEEDIVRSYELGCNSFISKPVDLSGFEICVRELGAYWFDLVSIPSN